MQKMGQPWIYARQAAGFDLSPAALRVEGRSLASKVLQEQWTEAEVHSALVVAASAGKECEEHARELWRDGRPDEYFFLEVYGSAVVEHLITSAGGQICAWAEPRGMAALPHYSPGYPGWDMSDQFRLFDLVQNARPRLEPGDLRVLDSGMLQPKKSMLAVFGITLRQDKVQHFSQWIPCHNCSLPGCVYRRAPYKQSLPQIEDVRRLQPGSAGNGPLSKPSPAYRLNARALRKWSQERLHFRRLPDGSVQARFRYEGTTCANLGRPLGFDYHVLLQPSADGYRIVEAACAPAPGDTGHTAMCEYINDPTSLMTRIAGEEPLLGRPLNEILAWERADSPSGCYCDAAGRLHKWGLVFEVIHYALDHSTAGFVPLEMPEPLSK